REGVVKVGSPRACKQRQATVRAGGCLEERRTLCRAQRGAFAGGSGQQRTVTALPRKLTQAGGKLLRRGGLAGRVIWGDDGCIHAVLRLAHTGLLLGIRVG